MKKAKRNKFSTRVHQVALAPLKGPTLKKRPRGKPFTLGHSVGAATRFKKGDVHNPHGRPATAKYSEALRALLPLKTSDPIPCRTNAEKMAATAFQLAVQKKNLGAICEIGDRTEGRASVSISVDGNDNPMAILIASMDDRSDVIGLAEGRQRQLTEGADGNGPTEEGTVE